MTEIAAAEAYPTSVLKEPASAPEAVPNETAERPIAVEQNVDRNEGIVAGIYQNVQRILAHHQLKPEYVGKLTLTFAESQGFIRAKEILHNNNTVVLVAEADCGRHHTAVALLAQLTSVELREVRREVDDKLDLNALELELNKGWLLDLRREPTLDDTFGRHLLAFGAQLKSRNSYLVVIVPPSLWRSASQGAGEIAVSLEPVPAADIVAAHLEDDRIASQPYLEDEQIKAYLAPAKPREAVRWAENIRAAASLDARKLPGAQPDDNFQDSQRRRIELVLQLHNRWRDELLQWHKSNNGSRERHFLLAAAVLEGLPAGLVFTTSLKTPMVLGEVTPEAQGLAGPGILELIDVIDARLASNDTVSFAWPDYANAVLDYFWLDRQHLRTRFTEWLCRLPVELAGDKHLSDDTRDVINRIANYALRWTVEHKSTSLLWQVIRTWSQHSILQEALPLLLTAAALEESLGSKIREEMLSKARADGEILEVKSLIATVCGGEMAQLHPTAALRRLAELAQSSDERLTAAVAKSVEQLWDIHTLRERLTRTVGAWCASEQVSRRRAGMHAFLALAFLQDKEQLPGLLSSDHTTPKALFNEFVHGWRAVFELRPEHEDHVARVLQFWVRAACITPEIFQILPPVLHAAVNGREGQPVDGRTIYYFSRTLLMETQSPTEHVSPRFRQVRDEIAEYVFARQPEFDAFRRPTSITDLADTPPHA